MQEIQNKEIREEASTKDVIKISIPKGKACFAKGLTQEFKKKELHVITGENGSGKSVIIKSVFEALRKEEQKNTTNSVIYKAPQDQLNVSRYGRFHDDDEYYRVGISRNRETTVDDVLDRVISRVGKYDISNEKIIYIRIETM